MGKIIGILYKIYARLTGIERRYISKTKNSKGWVYISYIPEVFYNLWNTKYMQGHQSRQEMREMVHIFNELGYNVYVANSVKYTLPDIDVKIVFGIEPGFVFACEKYKSAKKIYYATGAYFGHQNKMIKLRTDAFNEKYKTSYPYQRLVDVENHLDYADYILQIGSKFTIETYPAEYRSKITTIHQSSTVKDMNFEIKYAPENEYMWIGGGGSILKGLDLVVDYFLEHKNKIIHIVGKVDEEFLNIYSDKLSNNIIFHGYMNLNSDEFKSIAQRCNYMIYPSCTEGGCPGAVINAMYYGLIPIVSKWAAFDEIEDFGYLIPELTQKSLTAIIHDTQALTPLECARRKNRCKKYVENIYRVERFRDEFREYFSHNLKV